MRGMERKMKISKCLHSDDATSVMLLVQKLQQESYVPILLYKPQGGAVVVGSSDINLIPNLDELFMLSIQGREQSECLEKFAIKISVLTQLIAQTSIGFNFSNSLILMCLVKDIQLHIFYISDWMNRCYVSLSLLSCI